MPTRGPTLPRDGYDVAVVGAGVGGIYAVHRFARQGLSVLGLEGAGGVGGVWYHNRYPGARVDVDSVDYSYHFSPEIADKWRWEERYATQAHLLEYLGMVADSLGVNRHVRFGTELVSGRWDAGAARWELGFSTGERATARFVVMATGNLSESRRPAFEGLDRFGGEWVLTSHWPQHPVAIDGRRVAVVGTGSSGVQAATAIADRAAHLFVFQRSANYSVPARNRPLAEDEQCPGERILEEREDLLSSYPAGTRIVRAPYPRSHYTEAEQRQLLEAQWERGGQGMNAVFADQAVDPVTNGVVSEFVRDKIRATVADPAIAETLCPRYPIGTKRLILDTGYYEIFNRDNVILVDVRADPIVGITGSGIVAGAATYEVDLIVFALGFHAFRGVLDRVDLRNDEGRRPTDAWGRGPRTVLGLMTCGFPNVFLPTGPGSPSVLANMILLNEFHVDWIADCIARMDQQGRRAVEPTLDAEEAWTAHVAELSAPLLRRQIDNYMVHVNSDDGSRVFMPYAAGLDRYVAEARAEAAAGYPSFRFA